MEGEREKERESDTEEEREMQNMVIEFISLLLTMAALCIKCFSIVQNCYFLKGTTGALATFSYLVHNRRLIKFGQAIPRSIN